MSKQISYEGEIHEFPDDFTDQDISKALSSHEPSKPVEKVPTFLGQMPRLDMRAMLNDPKQMDEMIKTYAAGGPLASGTLLGGVRGLLGNMPKVQNALRMIDRPLSGAALGGSVNPEHPVAGAIAGGVLGSLPGVAGKVINTLKPSNLFRGSQTPEQLQNALNVTKGTETPLGDVLQSPFLKGTYENVIAKIPFSGATESMMKTGKEIVNKGQSLMGQLLGKHSPANVEGELHDTLVAANKFHRNLKTKLYDEPDKIANQINLKLSLPSFSRQAKQYADAIEGTNILKTEPEFKSLMNKLKGYETPTKTVEGKIISKEGKPLLSEKKYPTLKEANTLVSHLNDIAERYASSPNTADRNASAVFKRLATSLKNDVKSAVQQSGHKELQTSFDKAEKNYAENYSPFLEKEIYKFANGKGDPDMIVQAFIKTGKATDRANLLGKFVSKLPEDKRQLLGYAYLKRAINQNGEVDPLAFKNLISTKNLGKRQFDLLFPGKLGQQIKNYADLVEKNPEAFQLMKNPKTGARLSDFLALGGLATAPMTTIGSVLSSRALNKLITSPTVREKLVNKMLEK